MESRINKKSGNPNVPNFGFVVFDEERAVQAVLGQKGVNITKIIFSTNSSQQCIRPLRFHLSSFPTPIPRPQKSFVKF